MPQSPITSLEISQGPNKRFLEVQNFLTAKNYTKRKAIPKSFSDVQKCYIYISRGEQGTEELRPCIESVRKAIFLYNIPSCKALLNGFLISEESAVSIAAIIKDDPGVVSCYSHLYFDTSAFFNDLLKIAYIRSLPTNNDCEVFEKQVLSWGHYLGAKYIAWKIGCKSSNDILPSQAVKRVLDDSIWRSSEHALEDISSPRAKESRAWVPQVLKSAELLNNIETTAGMENALSELKIKLTSSEDPSDTLLESMEIKG